MELSNLIERYRISTGALERFVHDSISNVYENRSKTAALLKKILAAGAEEEVEGTAGVEKEVESNDGVPGEKTATFEFTPREYQVIVDVMKNYSRMVDMHPQMLLEMSIIYAGALFDAFISDILLAILRNIPERLRSGRTLTAKEVLEFRDRDEIIDNLASREVLDLMYKSVEKQFEYFHSAYNVDVFANNPLEASAADLAAARERRNLITHNNGLASSLYVKKYNNRMSIGDRVITDAKAAESDRELLREMGISLASQLRQKLASDDQ